ncbi:hypothetical protein FOXYSP1_19135 [Fusarium oxysporum f. sp. phaseoli]
MLENPGIPLPFRIQTNSLKVLDLKFKVLDEIIIQKYIFSPSTTAQYKQQLILKYFYLSFLTKWFNHVFNNSRDATYCTRGLDNKEFRAIRSSFGKD